MTQGASGGQGNCSSEHTPDGTLVESGVPLVRLAETLMVADLEISSPKLRKRRGAGAGAGAMEETRVSSH
jgi:hypothetical protein